MVCETCRGDECGEWANEPVVCPECQDSSIVSCCDTAGAALQAWCLREGVTVDSDIFPAAVNLTVRNDHIDRVLPAKDFGNAYENIGKKR